VRLAELAGVEDYRVVEAPRPAAGELLVEVAACGVCASELDAWIGRVPADFPVRNGHEVSGIVVQLDAGATGFAVGDRVAVWTTGSGYAEYMTAPAAYCRALGDVPLEVGLLEPIACAANPVAEVTGGRGADVTFEVTGVQGGLELVGDLTRMSGKVVLVGFHQGVPRAVPLGHWNVTHRFDLADINDAFRAAVTKPEGFVKAVVTMGPKETR
jgi:threonine dehydrogenase-like Zn-dependent dehydrogenase